jgi:hypothetical protein
MKKLLLIALIAFLTACTTTKFVSKDVYLLDFRPYTEKGFLMSTTNIGANYSSIGEINISCNSGYIYNEDKKIGVAVNNGNIAQSTASMNINKNTPQKQWTVDEVLAELYNEAKAVGANGVINIKVETDRKEGFVDYHISGLAVNTLQTKL